MVKTVGVLGLGVFGSTIATELGEQHYDVIAVDKDLVDVNRVEEYVVQAIQGNFTDIELLRSIGFSNCEVVVIGTGSNLEASVMAIMNCKKLGIKRIIAKAKIEHTWKSCKKWVHTKLSDLKNKWEIKSLETLCAITFWMSSHLMMKIQSLNLLLLNAG